MMKTVQAYLLLLSRRRLRHGHEIKELVEEPSIDRIRLQRSEGPELVEECKYAQSNALRVVLVMRQFRADSARRRRWHCLHRFHDHDIFSPG